MRRWLWRYLLLRRMSCRRSVTGILAKRIVLAALLSLFTTGASGQPSDATGRGSAQMFVGETLTYDGKLSRLKIGWSIADLVFKATSRPDSKEIVIRAEAVSQGTLLKLLRFSFVQEYESLMSMNDFRVLKTTKHDVQKQRVRDSEAFFDYEARSVTYVETDPKDATRPPRRIASAITPDVLDMISAIYAVRLMPLEVGTRGEFAVSDSGLVYKVPFAVTKRERQSTATFGKVTCLRVEPDIFGPGRLIEQKGKMVIWMTDDPRHVPVRAEVTTDFGKVNIKLGSYQKTVVGPDDRPAK